jgi:hypothetical protein
VDLLLLKELITDVDAFREVCERVFAHRKLQSWPPFVEAHEHWELPFARMAREIDLPIDDLHTAVYRIRSFVREVDPRAQLLPQITIPASVSSTTWYYLVNREDRLNRLSAQMGEELLLGHLNAIEKVPKTFEREDGAILMIGVVVALLNRKPTWVEHTAVVPIALDENLLGNPVDVGPAVWRSLASEIQTRARVGPRAAEPLAKFLSSQHRPLPAAVAPVFGVRSRYFHMEHARAFSDGLRAQQAWDLRRCEVIEVASRTGPGRPDGSR